MNSRPYLVAGETLVDFLPDRPGPLSAVEGFTRRAGGAPANVAVGLTQLDRKVWFWTRLGRDPFGEFLAATLEERGIPDRFVERDPDALTSLAFVSHAENADRDFTFYGKETAETRMQAGTVPDDVLESVEWVVVGGVSFSREPTRSALFDLLDRARQHGCTVVFDPNTRPELWPPGEFDETITAVLAESDVVKASPADLREAGFGGKPPELARALVDHGPHTVFITRGRAGAYALATDASPWGPATVDLDGYEVTPVDTTGAGDAFVAGLLAALEDGDSLQETVSFANAVAGLSTTGRGAMESLPDRNAVEEFLTSS